MTRSNPARPVEDLPLLDLLRSASIGVFPGAVLETLIDRLETRR